MPSKSSKPDKVIKVNVTEYVENIQAVDAEEQHIQTIVTFNIKARNALGKLAPQFMETAPVDRLLLSLAEAFSAVLESAYKKDEMSEEEILEAVIGLGTRILNSVSQFVQTEISPESLMDGLEVPDELKHLVTIPDKTKMN